MSNIHQISPIGLALQSSALGLINYLVFHKYEPDKNSFFATLVILVVEPLFVVYRPLAVNGVPRPETYFDIWTLFVAYFSFYFTLTFAVVLYRISPFHPLAGIPGPLFYKISKAWTLWNMWDGSGHRVLKRLHDHYGPWVRIGPNEVSIADASIVPIVLGIGGLPKGQAYSKFTTGDQPRSIITLTGEAHTARRRLWNRALNSESLKGYEETIRKRAQELVDRLQTQSVAYPGCRIDIVQWLNYFTVDFMSDMGFGRGSNLLKTGFDKDDLWERMEKFNVLLYRSSQLSWLPDLVVGLPWPNLPSISKFLFIASEWSTTRLQRGSQTKDIWYHLADEAGLEKTKLTPVELTTDAVTAIIAGSDTTSAVMAACIWLLLSHPEYYKRVQDEVDEIYPPGSDALDVSKHASLPYLTSCINEALRLFPPVPVGGSREVPRGSGGKVIGGRFLPEGTQIYISPYVLHRDRTNFSPRPDDFIPERWAKGEFKNNTGTAFIPFSYGPANCVGKNLAKQEMTMILALLIQTFDLRFAEGFDSKSWPETIRAFFASNRSGCEVVATLRSNNSQYDRV